MTVDIVECADDNAAKLRGYEVCSANGSCHGLEIWDSARRVYRYPDDRAPERPAWRARNRA
jgi:hypothetical protein